MRASEILKAILKGLSGSYEPKGDRQPLLTRDTEALGEFHGKLNGDGMFRKKTQVKKKKAILKAICELPSFSNWSADYLHILETGLGHISFFFWQQKQVRKEKKAQRSTK